MSFTDEDLKRLKDGNNALAPVQGLHRAVRMSAEMLEGLIARTEAAEFSLVQHRKLHNEFSHSYVKDEKRCAFCIADNKWRKAAGK